jgi:hypothetical protein
MGSLSPVSSDSSTSSCCEEHRAVDRDLVARGDLHDIAEDDLVRHDLDELPVADHPHPSHAHEGQPVERGLGPQLLHDADQGVGDEHDAEEGVAVLTRGQHDDEQPTQDGVEAGEHVGSDDVDDGAAVLVGGHVHEAPGLAVARLGGAEADHGVDRWHDAPSTRLARSGSGRRSCWRCARRHAA